MTERISRQVRLPLMEPGQSPLAFLNALLNCGAVVDQEAVGEIQTLLKYQEPEAGAAVLSARNFIQRLIYRRALPLRSALDRREVQEERLVTVPQAEQPHRLLLEQYSLVTVEEAGREGF